MPTLVEKIHLIHKALRKAELRHAFGGAIALAWCTLEPRGTRDLDVNVFIPAERAEELVVALPDAVKVEQLQIDQIVETGQTRLWWDETPLDFFLNNLPLHEEVSREIRWVEFAGQEIPVLSCESLVLFKAFFDRTKDWADIEAVAEVDRSIVERAAARTAELLGEDSPTVRRLNDVAG